MFDSYSGDIYTLINFKEKQMSIRKAKLDGKYVYADEGEKW